MERDLKSEDVTVDTTVLDTLTSGGKLLYSV